MKLRIYRNSLRFRLTPADVAILDETGLIVETVEFGPGIALSYSLRAAANIEAMRAVFDANLIRVEIPAALLHAWRRDETVGLRGVEPLGNGKRLDILVEKDFACFEDQANDAGEVYYPNPNKPCAQPAASRS